MVKQLCSSSKHAQNGLSGSRPQLEPGGHGPSHTYGAPHPGGVVSGVVEVVVLVEVVDAGDAVEVVELEEVVVEPPHGSQQLAAVPTVPFAHRDALRTTRHLGVSFRVAQHLAAAERPHIDRTAQRATDLLHWWGSVPAFRAAATTLRTQLT